jgi:sulfatase modifying factor 1
LEKPAAIGAACVTAPDCVNANCIDAICAPLPDDDQCDGIDEDLDGVDDGSESSASAACAAAVPGTYCNGTQCACEGGLLLCDSGCVDTATDPGNCGDCSHSCPVQHGLCDNGVCSCDSGLMLCGSTCLAVVSDPTNCGDCGVKCGPTQDCAVGTCRERASCLADDTTCQGGSCCNSLPLPGGAFLMGRSDSGTDSITTALPTGALQDAPEHSVTLPAYRLDKYEVTVGRFARFLEAFDSWRQVGHPQLGEGASPNLLGSGWSEVLEASLAGQTSNGIVEGFLADFSCGDVRVGNAAAPMACAGYPLAVAFCAWDGGWLPTEAEWEFSAAGGDENRLYPWGGAVPLPGGHLGSGGCFGTVGRYPAGDGLWGHSDLAGYLAEIVVGTASSSYSAAVCTENCGESPSDSDVVLRGGDCDWFPGGEDALRAASRRRGPYPTQLVVGSNIGFRCARASST